MSSKGTYPVEKIPSFRGARLEHFYCGAQSAGEKKEDNAVAASKISSQVFISRRQYEKLVVEKQNKTQPKLINNAFRFKVFGLFRGFSKH